MSCHSNIDKPNHYQLPCGAETIEIIKDLFSDVQFEAYCVGNVVKYVSRYDKKNGIEDLKKAIRYIEFIIENRNDQGEY